jgi:transposase
MKPIKAHRLVGIDLGAKYSQICIIDEENSILINISVPSSLEAILAIMKKYDALPAPVAVEATFSWYWLVDGLQDHGCDVHLVHASGFSSITKAKVKTDKRDAKTLAINLHSGNLPESYIYPRESRGLRDLTRQRNYTVEKNSGVLRKLRCLLYREGYFKHCLDDAKGMEADDLPRLFHGICPVSPVCMSPPVPA